MRDLTYPIVIPAAKAWFKAMDFRIVLSGTEHIPRQGGALLAFNHISYVDFILGGFAAERQKRLTRFMAKRETFDSKKTGWLMRSLHHINVDRADGVAALDVTVDYLRSGEVVGIFPEATISRSFEVKEIKTGATRIAALAEVPLIPVALWGTQRLLTKDHPRDFSRHKTIVIRVGEPLHPTGADPVGETRALRSALSTLVDEAIRSYPAEEQPPGSWWLPASHGGSAPTPEEATRMDREESKRRAQERRAARKSQADPA